MKETRPPADIGKAVDQLKLIAGQLNRYKVQKLFGRFWALVRQCEFLDFKEPPSLSRADFIPVPDTSKYMQQAMSPRYQVDEEVALLAGRYLRPFGEAIEEVEPEDTPPDVVKAMIERNS